MQFYMLLFTKKQCYDEKCPQCVFSCMSKLFLRPVRLQNQLPAITLVMFSSDQFILVSDNVVGFSLEALLLSPIQLSTSCGVVPLELAHHLPRPVHRLILWFHIVGLELERP